MKNEVVQKPAMNEGEGKQSSDISEWSAGTNEETYEFLDNLDFLKHIDVSEYEKEVLGGNKDRLEKGDEIAINIDFLDDLAFFDELDYFEQLNKSLEQELRELDSKLRSSPIGGLKRWMSRHSGILFLTAGIGAAVIIGATAVNIISRHLSGTDISYASTKGYGENQPGNNQSGNNDGQIYTSQTEKPKETNSPTHQPGEIPIVAGNVDGEEIHKSESMIPKQTQSAVQTAEPAEDPVQTDKPTVAEVSDSELETFYEGSVFVGNSLTVGLQLTSGVSSAKYIAAKSLNVTDALTKPVMNNGTETAITALQNTDCDKVYLMFGINEIGWPSADGFADKYEELIEKVKEVKPDATIYVQSILPITKSRSQKGDCFTKDNVDKFNEAIKKTADKAGVEYLDINSALADGDGYLPEDAATDGIHLKKSYYKKWVNYIYSCSN